MISSVARDTRTQRAQKREGEAHAEPYAQPGRERKRGWDIGYQDRGGALLRQVVRIGKVMGQSHEAERQLAFLSKVTGPSFLFLPSLLSFHSLFVQRVQLATSLWAVRHDNERKEENSSST